jgi:hypothetical protein
MRCFIVGLAMLFLLSTGCATIADQTRIEAFEQTSDTYESAMRLSEFKTACQFVDPSVMASDACRKRYGNLKVTRYDVLEMAAAKDNQEVYQTVELEYFFLDQYVVRKIQHHQFWRYQEEMRTWLLQTEPPRFE